MQIKLKIFDDSKLLKTFKIITLIFAGILLLWFTFDITGLKFGNAKIVTSAFADEPIDFVFYLIYAASFLCFVLKDKIGKYALAAFLLLWGAFQFATYFKSGESITAYNKQFADTHHIISASNDIGQRYVSRFIGYFYFACDCFGNSVFNRRNTFKEEKIKNCEKLIY